MGEFYLNRTMYHATRAFGDFHGRVGTGDDFGVALREPVGEGRFGLFEQETSNRRALDSTLMDYCRRSVRRMCSTRVVP